MNDTGRTRRHEQIENDKLILKVEGGKMTKLIEGYKTFFKVWFHILKVGGFIGNLDWIKFHERNALYLIEFLPKM